MKLSSLFVLASIVVASFAATPTQVQIDISNVSSNVTSFNRAVTTLSDTELRSAIQTTVAALFRSLEKGRNDANDVDPKPVNTAEGSIIVNRFQSLGSNIDRALENFVAKKAEIEKDLNLTAVRQDLSTLNAGFSDLETALGPAVPNNLRARIREVVNGINRAFNNAINAFSGA